MINSVFLKKAKEETIVQAENGLWYLEPEWKQMILDTGMSIGKGNSWEEVGEILKLEVTKSNTMNSKKPYVDEWLYNLITAEIEPAVLAEETDYIKQVTEFMKLNHELKLNQ